MIYISALLISMFTTIALMPFLRKLAIRLNAMDIPGPRKVHAFPVPKCGGIAMAVGALTPVVLWAPEGELLVPILVGAGIITVFGMVDDFIGLRYQTKLLGQISAALVVIFYGNIQIKSLGMLLPGGMNLPHWFSILLTLLVIIGVTNAINLADGLDGLAGGICLLIFICLAYFGYRVENSFALILAIAVAGAIFGFLRFNTHPATLFMGDAGSQLLGFLAITLSLNLTQGNTPLSPLVPLILLGFPILDTLTVMWERILKGRSPFMADKNHFHHKLMRLGLYQTEAVFTIYVIQSLLVSSAFVFRFYSEWFLLTVYLLFCGGIILGFTLTDRAGWRFKRRGFFDHAVKGRLKKLKERNLFIKISFRSLYAGFPILLFLCCFLIQEVPLHVSLLSLGFVVLVLLTRLAKKEWVELVTGRCLFLFIPFVIYLSEKGMVYWMNDQAVQLYNLFFVALTVFVFLTLRLTRRKKGFEITPMHYLILFIAIALPQLPDQLIRNQPMGMVAAKMMVLFFSFEVLVGELRGNTKIVKFIIVTAMVIVGVRGIIGV